MNRQLSIHTHVVHASGALYLVHRVGGARGLAGPAPLFRAMNRMAVASTGSFCEPLTASLARQHSRSSRTLFVTFANRDSSEFAANWASQLQSIGISGLVGAHKALPRNFATQILRSGSSVFCCKGEFMERNGQAGRWAEVAPLLRFGLHVLISDADISWLRDPRPYFQMVRQRHPMVDFLLCTDRAFNGYVTEPLLHRRRPMAHGPAYAHSPMHESVAGDLDLEDGSLSAIPSYNIGILFLYAHAASNISAMIDVLWMAAVRQPTKDRRGHVDRMVGGMAAWDQGPINTRVLHGRPHPHDRRLVLIDRALPNPENPYATVERHWDGPRVRLGMGVLPMLQFATAYTYFIKAELRNMTGARPYSLHAIYSHGHDHDRKRSLLREAQAWIDPPEYYAADHHRFMSYDASPSERARRQGGFELILSQLVHFELALRVAALANRTLILPQLRCGAAAMAYPCYAWYHRAMMNSGFRHDTVPVPDMCPTYYWLNMGLVKQLNLQLREPSFLTNPRTPSWVTASRAELRICPDAEAGAGCVSKELHSAGRVAGTAMRHAKMGAAMPAQGRASTEGFTGHVAYTAAKTSPTRLAHAMAMLSSARVLHISDLALLSLEGSARPGPLAALERERRTKSKAQAARLGGGLHEVSALTTGFWCTSCVITRRGGVIQEMNRSSVRELERFCRVEARGDLGRPGSRQSCCKRSVSPQGCPLCTRGEKSPRNESDLPFHMRQFLPTWANLPEPPGWTLDEEHRWRCTHPLCTGADPDHWP